MKNQTGAHDIPAMRTPARSARLEDSASPELDVAEQDGQPDVQVCNICGTPGEGRYCAGCGVDFEGAGFPVHDDYDSTDAMERYLWMFDGDGAL